MNESRERLLDSVGATASTLCAVHCAICALLPAAFAALGLGVLLSHNVENALALVAVLFGLAAMRLARSTHRSNAITTLLAFGVVGLVGARGLELSSDHHHGDGHHAEHSNHGGTHHGEEAGEGHEGGDDAHEANEGHAADDTDHHEKTSGHEDGHADAHHDGDHHDDGDHDEGHHDEHAGEDLHLAGSSLGVAGGLLLALGHMLNLRAVARCREECCSTDEVTA